MTPSTPPPTTYDHKPAYDFAESMLDRMMCDRGMRWALVEAYMAGRAAAQTEAHASPVARGDG